MTPLPPGWVATTIGTVTSPVHQRVTSDPSDDSPYLSMAHVESGLNCLTGRGRAGDMRSAGMRFRRGDTLYGRLRPYLNKVYCPDFDGVASAEFIVFPTSCALAPRFLMYYLTQPDFVAFASLVNDGDRPRVKWPQIEGYPLPLPPLAEQHRIVEAIEEQFSRLDAGVASLRRAQRNLGRLRAAILSAAVEGRLVPQDPSDEPTMPALIGIKRQSSNESSTPAPPGWLWGTIGAVSPRVTVGYVGPMKHAYVDDGVPFLRSMNVRPNRFDPKGLAHIAPAFEAGIAKSRLAPGDVVVVRSGAVGVSCVIPTTIQFANCSDLVIVKKPSAVLPEFLAYYMNSAAQRLVRRGQVGVALIHFNTKSVAALPVPIPPLQEQHRIVAEVERQFSLLDSMVATVNAGLARAERLRQSILREAFAGRLVPQDADDEPASMLLARIATERTTA